MVVRRGCDRLGREVGKEEPTSPTKESRVESATVGATDSEESDAIPVGFRIVRFLSARRRLRKTCEAMAGIRRSYSVMVFVGSMVGRKKGTP